MIWLWVSGVAWTVVVLCIGLLLGRLMVRADREREDAARRGPANAIRRSSPQGELRRVDRPRGERQEAPSA